MAKAIYKTKWLFHRKKLFCREKEHYAIFIHTHCIWGLQLGWAKLRCSR